MTKPEHKQDQPSEAEGLSVVKTRRRRKPRGRPKGYKVSQETKDKIRATKIQKSLEIGMAERSNELQKMEDWN